MDLPLWTTAFERHKRNKKFEMDTSKALQNQRREFEKTLKQIDAYFFGLFSPTFFEYTWARVILCSIMLWARTWETGKEASGWKPKNHETEGIGRVFFTLNVYPHTFFHHLRKGHFTRRITIPFGNWWDMLMDTILFPRPCSPEHANKVKKLH